MIINRFLCVGAVGDRSGVGGGGGGQIVGRRHLLVTGNDAVYRRPAVSLDIYFSWVLMVRNSEQIIGVARSFFCFQERRRL